MAVVDKYVNADTEAGKLAPSHSASVGAKVVRFMANVAVDSGDDDGSIYRLFKSVPSSYIPTNLSLYNGTITAGTDYDIGFYKVGGAVVDADALADGLTMASVRSVSSPNNAGMGAVSFSEYLTSFAALAGETNPAGSYDIAITANTVGTASGTIIAILDCFVAA